MDSPRPRRVLLPKIWFWVGLAAFVLTQPFWQEPLLQRLHLHTPNGGRLAELTLASDRATRQVDNLQAQLRDAVAATDAARAETTAATRLASAAQARLSLLALIQLSAAMRHSSRFETELAMVWAAGMTRNDLAPLLERVRPYAPFGIPSLPQLRRDFAALTNRLDRSAASAWHLTWVASLVGWSRPVPPTNESTALLVGQARILLAEEDLLGALALVRQMPEPTRAALSDWIEDASARLGADMLARQVAVMAGQSTGASP